VEGCNVIPMNTTANLAIVPAAEADGFSFRWAAELKTPLVAPADAREFLLTAPVGTVIEFWNELYKRRSDGSWAELETILQGNEFVGSEHAETRADVLARMAVEHEESISIFRIGRD